MRGRDRTRRADGGGPNGKPVDLATGRHLTRRALRFADGPDAVHLRTVARDFGLLYGFMCGVRSSESDW
jgi:hypothetical protein